MDKFCTPNGTYHANTFLPLKEENSKNDPEMAGPKVSIIKPLY